LKNQWLSQLKKVATYKCRGIVIRRVNFAEADRILTILTSKYGKVSAIAKGSRRINSKLGAHLDLFAVVELMLAKGRNLDIVTGAQIKKQYKGLNQDYERIRLAYLFCEMIDKLVAKEAGSEFFYLLSKNLEALSDGSKLKLSELYFKLHLLDLLGYKPDLAQCVESRSEILAGKRYVFSAARGGVMEAGFSNAGEPKITTNHIKLWRLCLGYPQDQIERIKDAEEAAAESLSIANEFYDYLFGKRFKSNEI
jgi:DNA repair protein RecO (recombination protein O)